MACLNTLKLEIKTLTNIFSKTHERFQICNASVDELSCRFIGKNGIKYEIHANITVSFIFFYYLFFFLFFLQWHRPSSLRIIIFFYFFILPAAQLYIFFFVKKFLFFISSWFLSVDFNTKKFQILK